MGTAPIIKNGITKIIAYRYKGVTPIEKNIIVVDEQGNEYEATYPKRAKGLVKNGRARFVDENKICLACPPDKILEEDMEEKQLTTREIFEAINALNKESQHIEEAFKQLATVRSEGPEDIGAQSRAQAIAAVVQCRETTLQQTLSIYTKMYDDIQNDKVTKLVNLIKSLFENESVLIEQSKMTSSDKRLSVGYLTDKMTEVIKKVITE
ncbi:MAG: hypothetical protein J6Q70_04265 [Clostridia bacterium]|nr:hypothetical protein [Clostridia bacterium]